MSISFFGHTAFEWVGKKIAQCVTGKRDGEEKGAGQRGEGGEGANEHAGETASARGKNRHTVRLRPMTTNSMDDVKRTRG